MTLTFDEDKQEKKIELLRHEEEEELAELLSAKYGVRYVDLSSITINTDALRLIEETTARQAGIAVFDSIGKKINVALLSPQREDTMTVVRDLESRGYTPTIFMVSKASLEKAWSRYKDLSFAMETKAGSLDIAEEELLEFLNKVEATDDVRKLIEETLAEKKGYKVSRILEIILAGGLSTKASDIHIEPEENYIRLRFRLDGVLTDILKFDQGTYNLLLSRIKLLSGLKLNIKNNAQDGRFSITIKDESIEVRTSLLPGAYSESIVLRILNPKTIAVPMEELGVEPKLLNILEKEIRKPNGMILTTGPTGSGKTTTLYAFLRKIHDPSIKIITIEDPIEYHLPGIVQTQTDSKKGYTFLQGLRSALRQDPDVIMVGEIRDSETAEIAVNSALTGHLVFSTLHTNTAAGSFPRLIDLGVDSKILTSAINITLAQRLVRKLCPKCKTEIPIPAEKINLIKDILSGIYDKNLVVEAKNIWTSKGCPECNNTGYRGRIGIYEAILIDDTIEKILRENPSEHDIASASKSQGILSMREDGILKALKGITSIEELERVIDLEAI